MNKSYKHSFVVTDGLILSTESISDKTENTVVQEYEIQNRSQRLEVKFKEVEIDYLLQMGKSDGYEAYGISSGEILRHATKFSEVCWDWSESVLGFERAQK